MEREPLLFANCVSGNSVQFIAQTQHIAFVRLRLLLHDGLFMSVRRPFSETLMGVTLTVA